jgi:carbon monoxide dehydrogenase subunit G
MFTANADISVDASPQTVFSFLDEPRNHVKVTPSLVEVTDVTDFDDGGKRARYTYSLAGVELSGTVRDRRRAPPSRLVQELSGAIDGTVRFEIAPEDGGSRVRYTAAYELPDTVLDTVLGSVATAYNQREADATLANLKTHLEA